MKTYEEMAQSALTRGNAIRKRKMKAKKILAGALSGAAVCGLVLLLAFGMGRKAENPRPTESLRSGGPLNYGPVKLLPVTCKTDASLSGQANRYVAGMQAPSSGAQPDMAPPVFQFQHGYLHVVAKAVEECSGGYQAVGGYGTYRMFRMEVIDSLESGMKGEFYYLLPEYLKGDLTQYDALLISMAQLPKNFVLRNGDSLKAYEYLFADPHDTPELGNIIAFTNGVFDETLWQDRSWSYGYQFGRHHLDINDDSLLVSRGSTLEEALQRRQTQIEAWGEWAKAAQVQHYDFQTEAAQQVMAYVKPFENGVFAPERLSENFRVHRYINGCRTSEWFFIDSDTEAVTTSEYCFEDEDFEKLPDIPGYIEGLDLSKIVPQHMDPDGKVLMYNSVSGWYEKTESGVYSIVEISWRYYDAEDWHTQYYDETFILLDETGDHIISREELIGLIGDHQNIFHWEYGAGMLMPMC